jgi:hypothetical protein
MAEPKRLDECGYHESNKSDDSRITYLFGGTCCALGSGKCPYESENANFKRKVMGQIEGEGPYFFECPIEDAPRQNDSGLVEQVKTNVIQSA